MSKLSQQKKAQKVREAAHAASGNNVVFISYAPKKPKPPALSDGDCEAEQGPRFTKWRPRDTDSRLRYWAPPKLGDVVQCRFPDFLRGVLQVSQRKVRPALVIGVEEFEDGRSIVKVSYGTSQVQGDGIRGHGLEPGDLLVRSDQARAGLMVDTKFSFRKVVALPFDTEWFAPNPAQMHGVHPKRGTFDAENPENRRALDAVIREAKELGSLLDGPGPEARLRPGC